MRLFWTVVLLACSLHTTNAAITFGTDLRGSDVVPPVATSALGWGKFTLKADNTITYEVHAVSLNGVAAHIRNGEIGEDGSIVVTLDGGGQTWVGTTRVLTSFERGTLIAGGFYLEIDSAAHPDGEVRGQILIAPTVFGARLGGDQEVPPIATPGQGFGTLTLNPDRTLDYVVHAWDLIGRGTGAHIHLSDYGANGPIVVLLGSGPPPYRGTSDVLDVDLVLSLMTHGLNINVHTDAFLNGEIRGQIVASGESYGPPCGESVPAANLSISGAPVAHGSLTIDLSDGSPSDVALVYVADSSGGSLIDGCAWWIGAPSLAIPLALDDQGRATQLFALPDIGFGFQAYLQAVGLNGDGTLAYSTNAVRVEYVHF